MKLTEFQHNLSKTDRPVVIDFWATWCVPCRLTKPVLEKLSEEFADKVEFVAVDADHAREVLKEYKILGIPTVLAFQSTEEVGRVTGAQNEAGYRAFFESLATGREVEIPISTFDRLLRLGGGALLGIVGFLTDNLFVIGVGGIVAFLGIYDRCPIWAALTEMLHRSRKET